MSLRTIVVQTVIGLVLLEVCLRVYNPLPFRVRGDRIVLPVRQRYVFDNSRTRKLDPVTYHSKNSLGFRGPDPPADLAARLSILTVGGSTTECLFLSDGKTWTDALARRIHAVRPDAWVNNAGLDGQSSYGHIVLLRNFVLDLHPKVLVFLVGANDVERGGANPYDVALTPRATGIVHEAATFLADHVEIAGVAENLARAAKARRAGFGHREVDLLTARAHYDDDVIARVVGEHRSRFVPAYRDRLEEIVALCRARGVLPVLITQPALFGRTVDATTGVDLAEIVVNGRGNGKLEWELLEAYNDATRDVGRREGVLVIDLARELPKDSRYFYDFLHFTNAGAERVGEIVSSELIPALPDARPEPEPAAPSP